MVSSQRRRDPAGVMLTRPAQASNNWAVTAAQVSDAMPRGVRSERDRWAWMWRRMFATERLPMRGSCSSRPSNAACSSSATDPMPSSSTSGFHGLGSHARDFEHLQHIGRKLFGQAVVGGHAACLYVLLDLLADGLADAGDFLQVVAVGGRRGQRPAELIDGIGGALVGANLEDGIALDLQHGGHVVEQLDDVFVGDLSDHGEYLTTGQAKAGKETSTVPLASLSSPGAEQHGDLVA